MTFVDVTVGRSVIYLMPNTWLIKYKVRFLPIDVFSFILLRAYNFLISSLKCAIFVVKSKLGLSRTLL